MKASWIRFWVLVGLSLALFDARAMITYDLSFVAGDDRVTGSITTNGKSGDIGTGDILSWSFDLAGVESQGFLMTGSIDSTSPYYQMLPCAGVSGCFSVRGNALSVDAAHPGGSFVPLPESGAPNHLIIQEGIVLYHVGCGHCDFAISFDGPVVGVAHIVPEPQSVFLLCIGLAAAFGVASSQARRQQSTAV